MSSKQIDPSESIEAQEAALLAEEQAEAVDESPLALSRDAIFSADDLPVRRVNVPEWGGAVWVRTLTGLERDAFEESCYTTSGGKRKLSVENVRARLVALAACDSRGERIFRDGDADRLGRRSAAVLDRLYDVAAKLSGISETDVEELAKN